MSKSYLLVTHLEKGLRSDIITPEDADRLIGLIPEPRQQNGVRILVNESPVGTGISIGEISPSLYASVLVRVK